MHNGEQRFHSRVTLKISPGYHENVVLCKRFSSFIDNSSAERSSLFASFKWRGIHSDHVDAGFQ